MFIRVKTNTFQIELFNKIPSILPNVKMKIIKMLKFMVSLIKILIKNRGVLSSGHFVKKRSSSGHFLKIYFQKSVTPTFRLKVVLYELKP